MFLNHSLLLKVGARHTPPSVAYELHYLCHAAVIQNARQTTLHLTYSLPQKDGVSRVTQNVLVDNTLNDASRQRTTLPWCVLRHEWLKITSIFAPNPPKHLSMCELIEYFRLPTDPWYVEHLVVRYVTNEEQLHRIDG